jgi:hypothetical protein
VVLSPPVYERHTDEVSFQVVVTQPDNAAYTDAVEIAAKGSVISPRIMSTTLTPS